MSELILGGVEAVVHLRKCWSLKVGSPTVDFDFKRLGCLAVGNTGHLGEVVLRLIIWTIKRMFVTLLGSWAVESASARLTHGALRAETVGIWLVIRGGSGSSGSLFSLSL